MLRIWSFCMGCLVVATNASRATWALSVLAGVILVIAAHLSGVVTVYASLAVLAMVVVVAGLILVAYVLLCFHVFIEEIETSRELGDMIRFEEHVQKWTDGIISDDHLRAVARDIEKAGLTLATTIESGDSNFTAENIKRLKSAKILSNWPD